jgi:hypothetical protein
MRTFYFFVAAFLVVAAGCSAPGASPRMQNATTSQAIRSGSWMSPEAASGNLLYVSDTGYGAVFVYAYKPNGMKFVGILTGVSDPGPMCVDKQQNVWILSAFGTGSYAATEYAHGAAQPTATVIDPAGYPSGCGVNLQNGDLAVSSYTNVQKFGTIAIFKRGRGKPTIYTDNDIPGFYSCCAYDNKGNLYGDGTVDINQQLILAVLPKGSSTFGSLPMGRDFPRVAGLQWNDGHLTVGDKTGGAIYTYAISKGAATLKETTSLSGIAYLGQYFIDKKRVIAPTGPYSDDGGVGIFEYPNGGDHIRFVPFSNPAAVVLSRGPSGS